MPYKDKEKQRAYDRERQREYNQRSEVKIRKRKYNKQYSKENKEEINVQKKEYYQENKEEISVKKKEYYQENKEEIKGKRKKHYKEHKEEILVRNEKYHEENRDKILKLNRKQSKTSRRERRNVVLTHYGGGGSPMCMCCGEIIYEFLTIDHIHGRKKEDQKKGDVLYRWLIKNNFPSGFQVLCYNCNNAKGVYGVCPHNKRGTNYEYVKEVDAI